MTIRWHPGERLENLFEDRCRELLRAGQGHALAVDGEDVTITYAGLDERANRLAHSLVRRGVGPGDRIGLLFDRPEHAYVGVLGVLKAGAAYVPLDLAFPPDRLAYIASDSGMRLVLCSGDAGSAIEAMRECTVPVSLDELDSEPAAESTPRPAITGTGQDDICYVIYTSGSTGRPKGVPVRHSAICNFVRVAADTYGLTGTDRMYQGMTVAFDFSVEEIWLSWMVGATLVPKPAGVNLVGDDLRTFLEDQRVSALCCVPTVLTTLGQNVAGLRFLLVSGETCPPDLVERWYRPGRRFLNVYGPTEATVTASWTTLHPQRPVTIGVPLPTYSMVVLDPESDRVLPAGELGELGISGIGLAEGYLNRPELTERTFITDFVGMPANPSDRIYRTGDLARMTSAGDFEHHGRIDTQVKVRGYRIELTEIESVMREVPGIAQTVVSSYRPQPELVELVAYFSLRPEADRDVDYADLIDLRLRQRLPDYMVPAYLQQVAEVPMLPSGKADRKHLPAPESTRRLATRGEHVPPSGPAETVLAESLADLLDVDRVSVTSDFFTDLGLDSLLLARFVSAVRQRADLPAMSMRELYRHRCVRDMVAALRQATPASSTSAEAARHAALPPAKGRPRYALCGALQLMAFLAYLTLTALLVNYGFGWAISAGSPVLVYARLTAFGAGTLLASGLLPIAVKWLLIGRWRPARIRIWSVGYVRFWIVKTLVIGNPFARLCVGSPLYNWYLRALGARVGPRALILTQHIPVCTDLVSIGADAVIRKDTYLNGYRADDGVLEIGTVEVGENAFVGEQSVLDVDTALGDGAQLGHASALHPGQLVPGGRCWHGCPARAAEGGCEYHATASRRCGWVRRTWYSIGRLLLASVVVGPLEVAVVALLFARATPLVHWVSGAQQPAEWAFYRDAMLIAGGLVVGAILVGGLAAGAAGRLLGWVVRPDRAYPLYGLHYSLHRTLNRVTNIRLLTLLFGDSSAIVHYLRALGYRLAPVVQTGSNFGTEIRHEMPTLSAVGTATMVSDGLSLLNAEFTSDAFRVRMTSIGKKNFVGNNIAYPAGGRTGDDCLLGTKVMVPVTGEVRTGVGLLGSPSFEIPRSVRRDHSFDHLATGPERARRLGAKNRHNATTAGLFLLVRWVYLTGLVIVALLPFGRTETTGVVAGTVGTVLLDLAFTVGYFALIERAALGFRRLSPKFCSIYQIPFWRHERFWKVPSIVFLRIFDGTPVKSLAWRLFGVRCGRRVFDDGCGVVERSLTSIGDHCTLNMASALQGHSLEDGVFKSDYVDIRAGATVGVAAFVHYGVVLGEGAGLSANSFLMKAQRPLPRSRWSGNPAAEITGPKNQLTQGEMAHEYRHN
ncbi:Pls/PosA family non-ribosomal peptide synthetase [Amycolatopsis sp. GM8]|uniref:Pls/PosA family non-ribosomal peptide synthetase n=1 Tax=Amycolatopsis sp. GM8 TaxID=2896530 RepID=UPI001F1D7B31|nr:Pls/PosA family non-ribosomal peptide synthetase [Amycolatopsis sp. GM8]